MRTFPTILLAAGAISLVGCQAQQPDITDAPVRPVYRSDSFAKPDAKAGATAGATPAAVSLPNPARPAVAATPPVPAGPSNSGPMTISQMTVGRLVLPQSMQPTAAPGTAAPPSPIQTGQTVVVQMRRDALGLASPAPLDPLFEGVRFPVSLEGRLESMDERWVVLVADGRRLCINRDAVLLVYPRNEAGRREGASSNAPVAAPSDGSGDGVNAAKVDPAGRPALRGGPEGAGAN